MMEIKTHKESRIINHLFVQQLKIELPTRKHISPFPCVTCTQTVTVPELSFFQKFLSYTSFKNSFEMHMILNRKII